MVCMFCMYVWYVYVCATNRLAVLLFVCLTCFFHAAYTGKETGSRKEGGQIERQTNAGRGEERYERPGYGLAGLQQREIQGDAVGVQRRRRRSGGGAKELENQSNGKGGEAKNDKAMSEKSAGKKNQVTKTSSQASSKNAPAEAGSAKEEDTKAKEEISKARRTRSLTTASGTII